MHPPVGYTVETSSDDSLFRFSICVKSPNLTLTCLRPLFRDVHYLEERNTLISMGLGRDWEV